MLESVLGLILSSCRACPAKFPCCVSKQPLPRGYFYPSPPFLCPPCLALLHTCNNQETAYAHHQLPYIIKLKIARCILVQYWSETNVARNGLVGQRLHMALWKSLTIMKSPCNSKPMSYIHMQLQPRTSSLQEATRSLRTI